FEKEESFMFEKERKLKNAKDRIINIYIVRHGKAVSGNKNPHRPLSKEGKKETKIIASLLKKSQISPDAIWHSGKPRAEETAEIFKDILCVKENCIKREGLLPNDHVESIEKDIIGLNESIMIVSHIPFVERMARLLLGSVSSPLVFEPSAAACFQAEEKRSWRLKWLINPHIIL
ncbi:MAG: phosphohistidine phosphatase SixA, partial [Candidatus Aureabacteria bacterium]|nr:phosphohistidine phosphatase SixA [Candidatus Auribacterota bacterium]